VFGTVPDGRDSPVDRHCGLAQVSVSNDSDLGQDLGQKEVRPDEQIARPQFLAPFRHFPGVPSGARSRNLLFHRLIADVLSRASQDHFLRPYADFLFATSFLVVPRIAP
jgi:hypothetical protein